MTIKITGLQLRFDEEGNTNKMLVNYAKYEGENQVTCQVELLPEELEEGTSLDDVTKKEVDPIARKKIAGWFSLAE